jgi:hypothetical protein
MLHLRPPKQIFDLRRRAFSCLVLASARLMRSRRASVDAVH